MANSTAINGRSFASTDSGSPVLTNDTKYHVVGPESHDTPERTTTTALTAPASDTAKSRGSERLRGWDIGMSCGSHSQKESPLNLRSICRVAIRSTRRSEGLTPTHFLPKEGHHLLSKAVGG